MCMWVLFLAFLGVEHVYPLARTDARVNIGSLPQLISMLLFELESLPEPGANRTDYTGLSQLFLIPFE